HHRYRRLRFLYNKRFRFHGHETDYRTLCLLNHISELLRIPAAVRDSAACWYKRLRKTEGGDRPSNASILLICLLKAVRDSAMINPPSLRDVVFSFEKVGCKASMKKIIRAGLFCDNLGVKLRTQKSETYLSKVVNNVISFAQTSLGMNIRKGYEERLLTTSLSILRSLHNASRGGRDPYALAASTVYAANKRLAKEDRDTPTLTQKLVARACGVAEYTIREHWIELLRRFV
ncbi:MAG: hypothetical protein ACE5OY_04475, partial [Candidatus Bathyarchaeia archaeon]